MSKMNSAIFFFFFHLSLHIFRKILDPPADERVHALQIVLSRRGAIRMAPCRPKLDIICNSVLGEIGSEKCNDRHLFCRWTAKLRVSVIHSFIRSAVGVGWRRRCGDSVMALMP